MRSLAKILPNASELTQRQNELVDGLQAIISMLEPID